MKKALKLKEVSQTNATNAAFIIVTKLLIHGTYVTITLKNKDQKAKRMPAYNQGKSNKRSDKNDIVAQL